MKSEKQNISDFQLNSIGNMKEFFETTFLLFLYISVISFICEVERFFFVCGNLDSFNSQKYFSCYNYPKIKKNTSINCWLEVEKNFYKICRQNFLILSNIWIKVFPKKYILKKESLSFTIVILKLKSKNSGIWY